MDQTQQHPVRSPLLWIVFLIYIVLLSYGMVNHELWGDEIHSWNISKGSESYSELIYNTRYEGHPPLWYSILWCVSKFTHDPTAIQIAHFFIALAVILMILFVSPFSISTKILLPFGYFFLFEYTILSRNYALVILFVFIMCGLLSNSRKPPLFWYYTVLFLLGNTHLLGIILGLSLHLYFVLKYYFLRPLKIRIVHMAIGICILMPALYFIFPPSDSVLNTNFWLDRWHWSQLISLTHSPLRAFAPVPAWWEYHYWDTQFIIQLHSQFPFLKWLSPLISFALVFFAFSFLRHCRKALLLFVSVLFMIMFVSLLLSFTNLRHVGFIFIGFLAAYWLSANSTRTGKSIFILNLILLIQLTAGIISLAKDIKFSFSNGSRVEEIISVIPANSPAVTDYWCLNNISAFTDRPFYCIDLKREVKYLLWNKELKEMLASHSRYSKNLAEYLYSRKVDSIFFITTNSPEMLLKTDPTLDSSFFITLITSRTGAIERGGDLYLYKIFKRISK